MVTLFLTMLVGAGGNAGNQSAIKVIRGLVSQHQGVDLISIGFTLRSGLPDLLRPAKTC